MTLVSSTILPSPHIPSTVQLALSASFGYILTYFIRYPLFVLAGPDWDGPPEGCSSAPANSTTSMPLHSHLAAMERFGPGSTSTQVQAHEQHPGCLAGVSLKTWFGLASTVGYGLSKLPAYCIVTELDRSHRLRLLIGQVACSSLVVWR